MLLLRLLLAAILWAVPCAAIDLDQDGLDDGLEQTLIEQFVPTLLIAQGDCDVRPAEFRAGLARPEAVRRNGTLYAQATPRSATRIEIHYYHLWTRDCGRFGHPLDAEHVSVLLGSAGDGVAAWKALVWYAAAHQSTLCDVSNEATARDVHAESAGATIWVSSGKHASFLSAAACAWGCGGDTCDRPTRPLRAAKVINIGEPCAPLNGATWIASAEWPLLVKMTSDFDEARVTAMLEGKRSGVRKLNPELRSPQAVVLAGDATTDALGVSGSRTTEAVGQAATATGGALSTSAKKTGRGIGKAITGTARFLGGRKKKTTTPE